MKKVLMCCILGGMGYLYLPVYSQLGFYAIGGKTIFNFPDTALQSTQVNGSYVILQNKSANQTFVGSVILKVGLDTSGSQNYQIIDTIPYNTIILSPQDTVPLILNPVTLNIPPFKIGGGNVVVIWPIATGWSALDSASHEVYIIPLAGLPSVKQEGDSPVMINPVRKNTQLKDEKVADIWQLINTEGKIVQQVFNSASFLISPAIPEGVYILIQQRNQQTRKWKILIVE